MRASSTCATIAIALSVCGCGSESPARSGIRNTPSTMPRPAPARSFPAPRTDNVSAVRRVLFLDERIRPALSPGEAPGLGAFRGVGHCTRFQSRYRGRPVIGCILHYGDGSATILCGAKLGDRVVLNKDAQMSCVARVGPA